jgi:hypothetical protein
MLGAPVEHHGVGPAEPHPVQQPALASAHKGRGPRRIPAAPASAPASGPLGDQSLSFSARAGASVETALEQAQRSLSRGEVAEPVKQPAGPPHLCPAQRAAWLGTTAVQHRRTRPPRGMALLPPPARDVPSTRRATCAWSRRCRAHVAVRQAQLASRPCAPRGGPCVRLSPSDWRARLKLRADLRQRGLTRAQ